MRRSPRASKNLAWSELVSKDGTPYPRDDRALDGANLGKVFEHMRKLCGGVSLTITSGYRTYGDQVRIDKANGKRRHSESRSQHLYGRAIDIAKPDHMSISEFHAAALRCSQICPLVGGVGYYSKHIHLDIRRRSDHLTRRVVFWGTRSRA